MKWAIRDWAGARLSRALPADLFWPGNPFIAPVAVSLSSFPATEAEIAAVKDRVGGDTLCTLVLPVDAALYREIRLPAGARTAADAAIGLHLRQSLPAGGRGLAWRFVRKATGQDHDLYAAYILKTDHLERLVAAATRAGLRIASVGMDIDGLPPFAGAGQNGGMTRVWRGTALLCLVASILVSASLPWLGARRAEAERDDLRSMVASLQDQAVAAKQKASVAGDARKTLADTLARLQQDRSLLATLSALAVDMNDDSWAPEVTLSENKLYLAVLTRQKVPDLLAALNQDKQFASVRLDGPILPDAQSGQSRIQLVAELAAGGTR